MNKIHLLITLLFLSSSVKAQEVKFNSKKMNSYSNGVNKWKLAIDPKNLEGKKIDHVEYNLDGNIFKQNPTRIVTNSESNYEVTIFGIGQTTDVVPIIYYKDGSTEKYFHSLSPNLSNSIKLENTSKKIEKGYWEWSAFIIGNETELNSIQNVEYTLHQSFKNPVQIVYERGKQFARGFELTATGWGAFNLKAKVVYKNGNIVYLEHDLTLRD